MPQAKLRRDDLVEPELSYKILGVCFRVENELGPGLHEKYYQKAVAEGFRLYFGSDGVTFKRVINLPRT